MSNSTDVAATLSTTQKLGIAALVPAVILLLIGYFVVFRKLSKACNAVMSFLCAIMLLVVIGCVIAILAITDNPANLTWVVNHIS